MAFSVPCPSLVCGPLGKFFDVMCCVSLGTKCDGMVWREKHQSPRNERCEVRYESGWQTTLETEKVRVMMTYRQTTEQKTHAKHMLDCF